MSFGEGTIQELAPGKYRIRISGGWDTEKGGYRRIQRVVRCANLMEARKVARRLQVDRDVGIRAAPSTTFSELVERWLAVADLQILTRHSYESKLRLHIMPFLGKRKLSEITRESLDRWRVGLKKGGIHEGRVRAPLSDDSIRGCFAIVRRALNQAMEWGELSVNPAAKARLKTPKRKTISPPLEHVQALLEAADRAGGPVQITEHLAVLTGARRGELAGLRWSDVDLDAQRLTIRHSLAEGSGVLELKSTKSHQERVVPIDAETTDLLRARLAWFHETAKARRTRFINGYVLAHDGTGETPTRGDRLYKWHQKLCTQAGVPAYRFHDLRHAHGSLLLAMGVNPTVIQGQLGHAKLSTTLDIYLNSDGSSAAPHVDALARALGRKPGAVDQA